MNRVYFTNYIVESPLNIKIVLLSDIHYYNKKMKFLLDKIYDKVLPLKPNYICIPGDFIDERNIYDENIFLEFLSKLGKICPVVMSIGNHETKTKHDHSNKLNEKLMHKIDKIDNVHLLNNSSWIQSGIRFTGLTLPYKAYKENKISSEFIIKVLNKNFKDGIGNDKYNIVLSHSPYSLLYPNVIEHKFYKTSDLILSGHTHGGLTPPRIYRMMNRAFITPARHLFPKNSYGHLKKEKTIVSSGITKLSHFNPFRSLNFLFSSEIVIIELKK